MMGVKAAGWGLRGAAAGAMGIGATASGVIGATVVGGMQTARAYRAASQINGSLASGTDAGEVDSLGYHSWRGLDKGSLIAKVDRETGRLREAQGRIDSYSKERGTFGMSMDSLNPFTSRPGFSGMADAQTDVNRRMEAMVSFKNRGVGPERLNQYDDGQRHHHESDHPILADPLRQRASCVRHNWTPLARQHAGARESVVKPATRARTDVTRLQLTAGKEQTPNDYWKVRFW